MFHIRFVFSKLTYTLLPGIVNHVCVCYISSILFWFHWDFDNMRVLHIKYPFLISLRFWQQTLFLRQESLYWLFQIEPFCKLYLEVLMAIARLNLKTVCIDNLVCYISFCFLFCSLFSYLKKWLSYLSHAISPCLHGKLVNWTSAFYLSFCCKVLPRILNILIFMNMVISIICMF